MWLASLRDDMAIRLLDYKVCTFKLLYTTSSVFLPGESQGRWSLVGCHLRGHTELDTTEAT